MPQSFARRSTLPRSLMLAGWVLAAGLARADEAVLRLCGTVTTALPAATWQAAGLTPGAEGNGRDAFIAALLARFSGVKTSVVYMPSRRCIGETAASRMDGVLALSPLPERLQALRYPMRDGQVDRERRLSTFAYHWYARAGAGWQYGGKGLTGPKTHPVVGVVEGYSVTTLLKKDGFAFEPVSGGSQSILRMVARGRFDVAALLDVEVVPVMQKSPDLAHELVRLEPAYAVRDYYLAFSPALASEQPALAQKLWRTMPQVREITQRLNIDLP